MAAAFLVDQKRRSAEFTPQVEEAGIKFSMENVAEDIVNGLFCTYEPPTSKFEQYKAAKAARKHPERYVDRPHVPKSILKWKIMKSPKKKTTETPKNSDPPPAPSPSEARDDADDGAAAAAATVEVDDGNKKSVTWRDEAAKVERTEIENKVVGLASKYCGGACNQGEDIADFFSSPTGRAAQNFFGGPDTPGSMASMASSVFSGSKKEEESEAPTPTNSEKKVLYDDLGNPIREDDVQEDVTASYFPDTPKIEGAAPTPMASAQTNPKDPANGHSNLFCSNVPFMDTMVEGIGIAGVMAKSAAVAAGVSEKFCSPYAKRTASAETQLVRVHTPEQAAISEELKEAQESLGIYEPESYDQAANNSAFKLKRQSTPRHAPGKKSEDDDESQPPPTDQSYANSDITMGNSTVKHFEETDAKSPRKFNSMVEELKAVQLEMRDGEEEGKSTCFKSIKKSFEQMGTKSPRSGVVTNSYMKSLKSPSTPKGADEEQINGIRSVASLTRQFESPKAIRTNAGVRKSIDPSECRQFDGKMNFLPPTPRRKEPSTPTGYSMVGNKLEMHDWDRAASVNTESEIREEASTILDAGPRTGSLVKGPETVDDEDDDEKYTGPPEERQETEDKKESNKKSRKSFAKQFKKSMKKALKPVRKATKKVESDRIAPGVSH